MDTFLQTIMLWSWLVYIVLFLVMLAESAGAPVPGLTLVLAAAAVAGQGHLEYGLVFLATVAGGTVGGLVGYWLGQWGGRRLVERFGRFVFITPARLQLGEMYFQKHGSKAVLVGRYMPVLCFLSGILSGIAHLNYRRFFIYNFASIVLWSATHLTLAFIFGRSVETLIQIFNNIGLAIFIAITLTAIFLYVRYKKRQKINRVKVTVSDH